MKFFSLISEKIVASKPGEKVISQRAFTSLKKASDILRIAKKEAIDYRKKVVAECETQKDITAKEGFLEGLENFNQAILQLDHDLKTFRDEINKKILPIAVNAAKKILGEELRLHPDRIVDIVIQALRPVTQHRKITIYVNKADLEILEENKPKIQKILQQIEVLSLQERADIEAGGCIIETEAGIINAQLENQWVALEKAFQAFMKK